MTPPRPFSFVVVNDLHYLCPDCGPWLQGLVRHINATPDLELALILGDLAEDGTLDQLSAAKGLLDQLRVPWYPVPGNHDGPPNRPLNTPSPGLDTYEALFPHRRNYTFTHRDWQFLALDTTNGSGYQQLPIRPDTLAFAQHAAHTLDHTAPTILFTHMPLDPSVRFSSCDGAKLLDLLAPLNLRIVFSGHFHGRTLHTSPHNPDLQLLTNTCASHCREIHDGTTQRGYYLCRAQEDHSVSYDFIEYRR